jgi:hypothetical protein
VLLLAHVLIPSFSARQLLPLPQALWQILLNNIAGGGAHRVSVTKRMSPMGLSRLYMPPCSSSCRTISFVTCRAQQQD